MPLPPSTAGPFDPNDPNGPPQPPSAWQAMLHSVQGVMHFFGRLSFLVDENAHAVHFFVTALLQLLDRCGRHHCSVSCTAPGPASGACWRCAAGSLEAQ